MILRNHRPTTPFPTIRDEQSRVPAVVLAGRHCARDRCPRAREHNADDGAVRTVQRIPARGLVFVLRDTFRRRYAVVVLNAS